MKPVSAFPREAGRALLGVLFDLDDTLLDAGRLTREALGSLYDLYEAGLILVGVTGRPASWGQVLTRQWPVSGMITENGIIALTKEDNRVRVLDRASPDERRARREQLQQLVSELQSQFPELVPSDDVAGRFADFSFDIAESKAVEPAIVRAATEVARRRGARVVKSSIQLHLSYDADDKASGAVRYLGIKHGIDATRARFRFAFVGDSENDASCFAAFEHSFGVANLQGRPSLMPRYRAEGTTARGFSEIARALLAARS